LIFWRVADIGILETLTDQAHISFVYILFK